LVARVGIAAALLPLLIAGLAFAGVTVPDPARSAFDSVGVELPNQPADEGPGEANDRASEQGETSSSAGSEGKAAAEAKKAARVKKAAKGKSKGDDPTKPGRRVRRHGEGALPGPASPSEGRALGLQNATGGSSTAGRSPGKSAFGRGRGALRGNGHSK